MPLSQNVAVFEDAESGMVMQHEVYGLKTTGLDEIEQGLRVGDLNFHVLNECFN